MAVRWNEPMTMAAIRLGAARGVVIGTEMIRNEVIRLIMSPPKSGRLYRRRGVHHRASAPGQAPANDTGRLVNSIRTEYDIPNMSGRVIFSAEHALYLEFGTVKMEPRPFARRAATNMLDNIFQAVNAEIVALF